MTARERVGSDPVAVRAWQRWWSWVYGSEWAALLVFAEHLSEPRSPGGGRQGVFRRQRRIP